MNFGFVPEPSLSFQKHYNFTNLGLPKVSDLRPFSVKRHDQLTTSSCVAQSIVKGLEILRVKNFGIKAHVDLSRSALYYLTRELLGPKFHRIDNGSYISTAAHVLKKFGVCRENPNGPGDREFWPFDISKINIPPSFAAMRSAYLHKISSYYAIQETGKTRTEKCIQALSAGYPVVYGTTVYENILSYRGGVWEKNSGKKLGGHATCLVGWDGKNFIGENSWGENWGEDGFYYVSPSIIESSESSDFIVLSDR